MTLKLLYDNYDYVDLLDIIESFVNSPYNKKIGWAEVKGLKFIEFEFLLTKIKEKIQKIEKDNNEVVNASNNKDLIPIENLYG